MGLKEQFERAKNNLLRDEKIRKENRRVIGEFYEFEEYKLKRKNQLPKLDDACYKTLYSYIHRFRNVNKWFNNKPWRDLTKADIKRVYDAAGRWTNQESQRSSDRRPGELLQQDSQEQAVSHRRQGGDGRGR